MNVDLIIASSIFIVFISAALLYIFGFQKQGASWQSLIELRKEASDLASEIISLGNPENWNKENVIPSKIGLASPAYLIPILISDTSGYNRINEPIAQEIVFDEDCKNLAWNGTVRIFDENFNEIPFRFVNQTFCPSGFLQKAILFFEVNVSANSTRKLQVFFYNSTQVNPKDYGNFSSLVMWLTFDEGSGNIAYDYSGNGNHGYIYGATWINGIIRKALDFDGIDDYLQVPNSFIWNNYISNAFTISFFAYPKTYVTGYAENRTRIFNNLGLGAGANTSAYFVIYYAGDGKRFQFGTRSTDTGEGIWPFPPSNTAININKWYSIAWVWNYTHSLIYQDATLLQLSYDGRNGKALNFTGVLLAKSSSEYGNVSIDDVRIYNRALSNEEILSHYQQIPSIKIFPRIEVSLISFEKLEALRNISYDLLKDTLQKGYNFRVEIYEK